MDIKAAQLKNTRIDETVSSSVRTSAKVTENGKSFIDEMIGLPKIGVDNNIKQNPVQNKEAVQSYDKEIKSFEFVSKPLNDFSSAIKKENLSMQERQSMHKAAEKELVDEIVLMNNKQNSQIKDVVKNDLNQAQILTAQKTDNQIKEEKQEIHADNKPFEKIELKENFEEIKFIAPEKLELAENIENEVILPDKNILEEIKGEPENLIKFEVFEEPFIQKCENKEQLEASKPLLNKIELPEQKLSNIETVENSIVIPKTDVAPKTEIQVKEAKQEVKTDNNIIEQAEVNEKFEEIKFVAPEKLKLADNVENEILLPDKNVIEEIKGEPENLVKFEVFDEPVVLQKTETPAIQKFEEVKEAIAEQPRIEKNTEIKQEQSLRFDNQKNVQPKEKPIEDNQLKPVVENDVIQEVKSFEKPEKALFAENLINNSKIEEKTNKKPEKSVISKISDIKTEAVNEIEKVGRVKDITDEINVKPVDVKPAKPEDIKVIKMEISPLMELNNSLNTTKTSDIVKFIDANLSTESTKTSKTNSSKKADAKKASSEKAIKMTEADAKFFNNLIETNQQVIDGSKTAEQQNNAVLKDIETAQSAQVSKTLLNALKESQETNKPFRIDFDKDISVILRVNKNGTVSAEFLPGDEAVEQYLKANIPLLKQKFSDEGLEYDSLSYRQNKKESSEEREKHNRGNKKENGYE